MFLNPGTPWTFMNVSLLNMFWSKTGELQKELDDMDECIPIYSKIVRGHGTSANTVMRAESMLVQGHDSDAEILCHKSLYLGRSQNQIGLCLSTELLLARIAILRGDTEGYRNAIDSLCGYTANRTNRSVQRMTEMCVATLLLTLGETEGMADWLYDLEEMKKVLYVLAVPYSQILYGKLLLLQKRYNELYGLSDLMMRMADRMHYLLPRVYHLIYLTIANHAQGRADKARENLLCALHIALPDKVYLPFAEHGKALLPLLESIPQSVFDQKGMDAIVKLCKRQEEGMKVIRSFLAPQKSVLTPREREIALLAKERMTAKEIANQLFISDSTVRSTLKIIYSKLNNQSKAQRANITF
jgi:LuxR family maltose regulon positive regulatory protein